MTSDIDTKINKLQAKLNKTEVWKIKDAVCMERSDLLDLITKEIKQASLDELNSLANYDTVEEDLETKLHERINALNKD